MSPLIPDFSFLGFEASEDLRKRANLTFGKLLDLAPDGSMAVALIQKDDLSYRCAIEIYSKHGPFIGQASDSDPYVALENVERFLSKKLGHWKQRRFSERNSTLRKLPSVA